ncbi:EOGT [Symbiodinium sp. CCMP2592]|nr:EOGT [Symbiodinium sp. CCMP2592]
MDNNKAWSEAGKLPCSTYSTLESLRLAARLRREEAKMNERRVKAHDVIVWQSAEQVARRLTFAETMEDEARRCDQVVPPLATGTGTRISDIESFNVTTEMPVISAWRVALLARKANKDHEGKPFNRDMTNSDEVAAGLKASNATTEEGPISLLETSTVTLQQSLQQAGAEVTVLEMESLSIADQIRAIANTDLLISAHSAALSWMMALPPCAQVLEICAAGNYQFINYAKLAGVEHHCAGPHIAWGTKGFTAPVDDMVKQARDAKARRDKCLKEM